MPWSAEKYRAERARKRASLGIPSRDTLHSKEVFERGRELTSMMQLPTLEWDEKLFADNVDYTVPKMGRMPDVDKCANPICPQRHNHAVSRVIGDHGARQVLWYCNMRCRNRHAGVGS